MLTFPIEDGRTFELMVDISEYQAGADLAAYRAAGFGSVSLRVSNGARLDRAASDLAGQAVDAGLSRLYYVWVRPDLPAAGQVGLIDVALAGYGRPELGWMLDVEDTSNTLTPGAYAALVRTLSDHVQAIDGRRPVIYSANWYWDRHLAGVDEFADHPIIVANYPWQAQSGALSKPLPTALTSYGGWAFGGKQVYDGGRASLPRSGGWADWTGWQFTSVATNIPGFIGRNVDLNLLVPSWSHPNGSSLPPPLPVQEDTMRLAFIRPKDCGAQFVGPVEFLADDSYVVWDGWRWTPAGDPLLAVLPDGTPRFKLDVVEPLSYTWLLGARYEGDVPTGDGRVDWTKVPLKRTVGEQGPKGDPGPAGRDGAQGVPGAKGDAAILTVGTRLTVM